MRKYFPYIIIIMVGLVISIFSYMKLGAISRSETETVKIIVPTADIPAYKEILLSDLEFKEVPLSEVREDVVIDPQSIIGKQSKSPLYTGWPINKKTIEEKKQFKNKHIIAINIDYARSAAAKPGDIVDVYFVRPPASDWVAAEWAERVATEVVVLSIEGVNAKTGSAAATSTAILAVDKDFTHKIVPGATKENDRYVLAIRHQITEESVSVNEVDSGL